MISLCVLLIKETLFNKSGTFINNMQVLNGRVYVSFGRFKLFTRIKFSLHPDEEL